MAPISKTLALAGALFAATSSAAPVKRDVEVVWETVTDVVWTTVDVTTTVVAGDAPITSRITSPATAVPAQSTHAPEPEPSEPVESTEPVVTPTGAPTPTAVPPPAEPTTPNSPPPAPTTTVAPPPPSPTVVPPPEEPSSTTPASTPTSTGNPSPPSNGYNPTCSKDKPCTGEVTFYDTATSASAPGACGGTSNGHEENVIALPHSIMSEADCGKTVTVNYGGKTITGTVVDKCMGCDSTSIDLSRHFFESIAELAAGRLSGVSWWLG